VASRRLATIRARLRKLALAYPESALDHPWGEDVVKVRGKIFVFLGVPGEKLYLGVKLPTSQDVALMQPFATPMGYGLGKAGWIGAQFGPDDDPPVEMLAEWIDESYRAVAPKVLLKALSTRG
jgi:predicted DNA-binding protein (MmcQ/YjbR family)